MIDALFGSKTRVKLLHLFLNNPNRAFYVREITRKIDEQINSVRRELANMQTVGIIGSDSANNRLYYEVNQKYAYYEPLRQIFSDSGLESSTVGDDSNAWHRKVRSIGDVKVAIFSGQLVRGSLGSIDVVLAGTMPAAAVKRFMKELEKQEAKTLNYTVMKYEDFYYRLSVRDRFITDIITNKHALLVDTEQILGKTS